MSKKDIVWHDVSVNRLQRAQLMNQKPYVLWFTGLSGSGKSTLANCVDQSLNQQGYKTYLLDGDNIRHGLCSDLGFSDRDRIENIRRLGELCKLFTDAGIIVLASFISPFERDRKKLRQMVGAGEFIEVFVNTPLDICEKRDPKGLYKKARSGRIKGFTGIDSAYEEPFNADIEIENMSTDINQTCEKILSYLVKNNFIQDNQT